MDARTITRAIRELSPTAEFSFQEADLSTLDWHNSKAKRPTDKEILDQCAVVEAAIVSEAQSNAAAKAALLTRLGMTQEEANLLLS